MSPSHGRFNLRAAGALVLGVCVVALFVGALAWYHTISFEQALEQRVSERLRTAGFNDVELRIDGRTVVFLGEVDARVDRRRTVVEARQVQGVEDVYDRRVVTNYETGRHFELHSYAGITTVEGELPDSDDIAGVLDAIRAHYGVDPLGADLKVRPAVRRPPWLDDLEALLDAASAVSPLQIEYGNEAMSVSGEVADRQTRARVKAKIAAILGEDTALDVFLRLPSQVKEPELRIEYKNGRVYVSGTVPEDEFAEELIASLTLAFAVDSVDNGLRLDPDVQHSSWLEGVLRVVFPLAMTDWMDFQVESGTVTVSGNVSSDDELDIISEQLRENFDYSGRVVNRIRARLPPRAANAAD